jgi:hypothetical protein
MRVPLVQLQATPALHEEIHLKEPEYAETLSNSSPSHVYKRTSASSSENFNFVGINRHVMRKVVDLQHRQATFQPALQTSVAIPVQDLKTAIRSFRCLSRGD